MLICQYFDMACMSIALYMSTLVYVLVIKNHKSRRIAGPLHPIWHEGELYLAPYSKVRVKLNQH